MLDILGGLTLSYSGNIPMKNVQAVHFKLFLGFAYMS
jgi:hypothetical protein